MIKKYLKNIAVLIATLCSVQTVAKNLDISELGEGVYLHRSSRFVDGYGDVTANGLIVVSREEATLIDTPWDRDDVTALFNWLEERGLILKQVVITHSHEDAGGHFEMFHQRNIPTWTYSLTNQFLIEKGETPALNTFETDQWLIPQEIEMYFPGPAHTMDNSVVWLAKQQILFGGCMIRELNTSSLGYTAEGSVSQWPESVDAISRRYPNLLLVVPGHGEPGDTELLTHTISLARSKSQ